MTDAAAFHSNYGQVNTGPFSTILFNIYFKVICIHHPVPGQVHSSLYLHIQTVNKRMFATVALDFTF